jgi:hypothetical protein
MKMGLPAMHNGSGRAFQTVFASDGIEPTLGAGTGKAEMCFHVFCVTPKAVDQTTIVLRVTQDCRALEKGIPTPP